MMKYSELRSKFPIIPEESTTIMQRDYLLNQYRQELKKYLGKEIEINTISNLAGHDCSQIEDIEVANIKVKKGSLESSTNIEFNRDKFEKQIQTINKGDYVKIICILKDVSLSERKSLHLLGHDYGYSHYYYYGEAIYSFDLVSIENITNEIHLYFEKSYNDRKKIEEAKRKKESGCFIATACFGKYNSPEVLVLRQFRDDRLLKSFSGRVFVRFYYSVSPSLATLISKSDNLREKVRHYLLEPIVRKLQRQN